MLHLELSGVVQQLEKPGGIAVVAGNSSLEEFQELAEALKLEPHELWLAKGYEGIVVQNVKGAKSHHEVEQVSAVK